MNARNPDVARERLQQAFAFHEQQRLADAMAMYDASLAADPDQPAALHYSALLLHQLSRDAEAIVRLERALAIDGSVPDVWCNAGLIYGAVGRHADAVRALQRALELEPTLLEAWLNLSSRHLMMNEPVDAERAARRAMALSPQPVASYNLALALSAQGRQLDALEALVDIDLARDGVVHLGIPGLRAQLLIAVGRLAEARRVLDEALSFVDDPVLRVERAQLLESIGDYAASAADYEALCRHGFGTEDTYDIALSELTFMKKRLALWDGLGILQATFRQRVIQHFNAGTPSMLTPFSFLSDPSTRPEQRAAAEAWSKRMPEAARPVRELSKDRLRIGYLSADLHQHATGVLAVGLFERHDRERFETFAYSTGPDDGSALRRRLVASFEHFVDASGWLEAAIAERIAADRIDILVDLKGHTERASTVTMSLRPAPIAVSYLGYPGTMGAFVDYLIGDRVVTPLAHAKDYSEALVQLPHSYQPNDDRRDIGDSPSRADLGLPEDAVVLCGFNSTYKINADVIGAWSEILRRVPRAVLWLQTRGADDGVRARLLEQLTTRGVAAAQVAFAGQRAHADYLALFRCADLFLDTWPYNAHTTASDALWAGCPVLTVMGDTFAGRVAASLVTAVDMPQCIAPDRAAYIAKAVQWANDPAFLASLRATAAERVRTAPLFDTMATTRAIEAAYIAMARQYRAGKRGPILVNSDFTTVG